MSEIIGIGPVGTPEMIVIFVLVLVLFGAKKIPEFAKGIGKGMGEFKKAKRDFEREMTRSEYEAENPSKKKATEKKATEKKAKVVEEVELLIPLYSYGEDFSFLAYNVRNYLETDAFRDGKKVGTRYKPEQEISALVSVITRANPDIIGICEIGSLEDLKNLQSRLQNQGSDYQFLEHHDSADSIRRLALLYKFPIKKSYSRHDLTYFIGADEFPVRRGILHAEIDLGKESIHAIGVHLKSKRPSQNYDQAEMRLKEADACKTYIDAFLEAQPEAKLFLYGDFNDTYRSPPLNILKGYSGSPTYLKPLTLTDSREEYWTHFWDYQRQYSVFDYILCNKHALPLVNKEKSYILDESNVLKASDHRPLLVTFSLTE